MATHPSTLAWRIPGMGEPGGLPSMGSHRVGHDWHDLAANNLGFPGGSGGKESARNAGDPGLIPGSGRSPGEGNGYTLEYSCLENSMDRGPWWATVHGVTRVRHWEMNIFKLRRFLKPPKVFLSLDQRWILFLSVMWIRREVRALSISVGNPVTFLSDEWLCSKNSGPRHPPSPPHVLLLSLLIWWCIDVTGGGLN